MYAKIEENNIVEFPITEEDYNQNRYLEPDVVECYLNVKPPFDPTIERLDMSPIVINDMVLVNFEVVKLTLEDIFASIALIPNANITNVPQEILNALMMKITERVQETLDAFARTKDYDDIKSAITYKSSSVAQFQTEGLRCEYLRDTAWNNLLVYLTEVQTLVTPLPTQWSDIEARLPALTWV